MLLPTMSKEKQHNKSHISLLIMLKQQKCNEKGHTPPQHIKNEAKTQ